MLNDASGFQKIYLATGYTDLRRGMEGLANIIRFRFHLDPYDRNTLFLFCCKRSDRIKGLLWEEDGFLLLYKRLDTGAFSWPRNSEEALAITSEQYAMLMQGLEIIAKHPHRPDSGSKEALLSFVHFAEFFCGQFCLSGITVRCLSTTVLSCHPYGRNGRAFVDNSTENLKKAVISQVFSTVIHRHNDERKTAASWWKCIISAIMGSVRKGVQLWQSDTRKNN